MKLGLYLGYSGAQMNLPVDKVVLAEELGYDSVWTAEAYGSDAIAARLPGGQDPYVVAVRNSRTIRATVSGSSRCGACPAPPTVCKRAPGMRWRNSSA